MQQMMRDTASILLGVKSRPMDVDASLPHSAAGMAAVAKAGMRPYHRRATNNAKRLHKRP